MAEAFRGGGVTANEALVRENKKRWREERDDR